MANIDNTRLWSDNPEKFEEITKELKLGQQDPIERKWGELEVRTAWGVPHKQIQELSANHPDMTFFTEYSFEYAWWDTNYYLEYRGGEHRVIKAIPNHVMPDKIEGEAPCIGELEKKLLAVFRRLDVEVTLEDGDKTIDWCPAGEVTVTVEHDGYEMTGTKHHTCIDNVKVRRAKLFVEHVFQSGIDPLSDENLPF